MQCSFQDKKIAVFGANGSIGRGVCKQLLLEGARVTAVAKNIAQLGELDRWLLENNLDASKISYFAADVLKIEEVNLLTKQVGNLDGLVYSIGHCPPGGFDQSVSNKPNELSAEDLELELSTHVLGLQNVFKNILPDMNKNSVMVVISSAITSLPDSACPPWLNAGHYAAAKAAQDEWVKWLRRDPVVKEKEIFLHRLSLSAVDTWFHAGTKHKANRMISLSKAVQEIRSVLCKICVTDHVDKTVLPSS